MLVTIYASRGSVAPADLTSLSFFSSHDLPYVPNVFLCFLGFDFNFCTISVMAAAVGVIGLAVPLCGCMEFV
jgi:hypothetical protein